MMGRYRRELSVAGAYGLFLILLAVAAPRLRVRPDSKPGRQSGTFARGGGGDDARDPLQADRYLDRLDFQCVRRGGRTAGPLGAADGSSRPGGVTAGGALGSINGVLVARLGLPSIVVTLANLVIWRESLRYLREGEFVRGLPTNFQWFGMGQRAGQWLVVAIALWCSGRLRGDCATCPSAE